MKVLVVDDEENIRNSLKKLLSIEGIDSDIAENGKEALELINSSIYDIIISDLRMPVMGGLELLHNVRESGNRTPFIMISAHGSASDAVKALKDGASDYIVKPFDGDELIIRLNNIHSHYLLKTNLEINKIQNSDQSSFIGECSEIKAIKKTIAKISNSTANVLITGESGTGKEVLSKYIHDNSPFKEGPFMAINLAGIPDNLVESELFGYEKGAFTGASSRKIGLFEVAQNGTVFLDEIGDASLSLQAKLLRVLQEKKIMRLGGAVQIPINVRFIAATNRVLEDRVKTGEFRDDLYYRLNLIRISIPPLRKRGNDLMLLSAHLINKYSKQMNKTIKGLDEKAISKLKSYSFPGNVRELENIIERAVIFTSTEYIEGDNIEFNLGQSQIPEEKTIMSLKDFEKMAIKEALDRNSGNRTQAAEDLKISRRTLINKIEEYNL